MLVTIVVKVVLRFGDENLSASAWLSDMYEVPTYRDFTHTVEKALEGVEIPPLMEWCGEWKHMQQPNTYFRLMRKKSNLTLAADSQMQVTITRVGVDV